MTSYERQHRRVLAALVDEDPMDLAAPDNDLSDEYDAEAREIARRLVHVDGSGDAAVVVTTMIHVLAESFGTRLPLRRIARIATAIELGESSVGDLSSRLGESATVAAFVRAVIAARGRSAVVTVERDDTGRSQVRVTAPPGDDAGTEPLSIEPIGPGDGEISVRGHLIELGSGDLGPHQPVREPVSAIEGLVTALVDGSVGWASVHRRRDDLDVEPLRESITFVLPRGPFEIETHFGRGDLGRTRTVGGSAAAYPRLAGALVADDANDDINDELWDCVMDFSGLAVRGHTVLIPASRSVRRWGWTTADARADRVLVIEGAAEVDVEHTECDLSGLWFDGLTWEGGGSSAIRIEGDYGVTVRIRGTAGDRLRVRLRTATEEDERPAPSVTLVGADGRSRTFADIDAARHELRNEQVVGEYRGCDADGFPVTVTLTDVSGPWRRRRRLRRWLGPRISVSSTTTAKPTPSS